MIEEVVSLHVEGISCSHCSESIKKAVGALNGVTNVSVSVEGKMVVVEYDKERVTGDIIKNIIEDQGYNVK